MRRKNYSTVRETRSGDQQEDQLECIRRSRNHCGLQRESEGFIVPIEGMGQHNPARGKGPYFVHATKEWRIRGLPWR